MSLLAQAIIFLAAAIIAVPITRRLGFGSVLGYLAAGIIIGPFGLGLIVEPEHVLHFAELGVVFLLFIIGLELQPSRLWVLRRMVFGLGASQVLISAVMIALLAWLAGVTPTTAIVIGLTLALSSTAFVLQMLAEKKQLTSTYGRASFSILLFQDLAVIPLIAIMPILGTKAEGSGFDVQALAISVAALVGLIVGGHYLLRPVLRVVALTDIPELFTAVALFVVIGAALLMQAAGMSMVLGAFVAGMLLADSEYRHELEGDIAPFKGLLLGLFFIAVGAAVNLGLLIEIPGRIFAIVLALMLAKAVVLVPLSRIFGMCDAKSSLRMAAAMSQGGEFAFVLFGLAAQEGIIDVALNQTLILAVTVSMLLTPLLYSLTELFTDRFEESTEPEYDEPSGHHNDILVAGLGRVGQVVTRLLHMVGKPFTALEADPSQVDLVRPLRQRGALRRRLATGSSARRRRRARESFRHYAQQHGDLAARCGNRQAPFPASENRCKSTQPPPRAQAHGCRRRTRVSRYAALKRRDGQGGSRQHRSGRRRDRRRRRDVSGQRRSAAETATGGARS